MSAFRDLVEAIQEEPIFAMDFAVDPPTVFVHLPPIKAHVAVAMLEMRAASERWDRRKLKRMMRRAGQGKRTA